ERWIHLEVRVFVNNVRIVQDKMVRCDFRCHIDARPLGVPDYAHTFLCTHMTHVIVAARLFCEQYVPCDMDGFSHCRNALYTKFLTCFPLMYAATVYQRVRSEERRVGKECSCWWGGWR